MIGADRSLLIALLENVSGTGAVVFRVAGFFVGVLHVPFRYTAVVEQHTFDRSIEIGLELVVIFWHWSVCL